MKIEKYFTQEAQRILRREIRDAEDNEVFFVGMLDEENRVTSVKVLARGSDSAVAAPSSLAQEGQVIIHNHPGGDLKPSDEDVNLSSFFAQFSVGSFIVNNEVSAVYVLVEPFPKRETYTIDLREVHQIFSPGGKISTALPSYEFRSEQLYMAEQVARGLNNKEIMLIEAGTGTGKTFAYLVPALMHALLNKVRVVVSTNTINLQEQLLYKDVPFLERVLGKTFHAVLIKGRSNYICLRKLELARNNYFLFSHQEEKEQLEELVEWVDRTHDGSRSDLGFIPDDELWEKVSAESENCLRIRCPLYQQCFFYKARRSAAHAEIIIINHHLLFADMVLRDEVEDASDYLLLPPFDSLVIDEAHNVEEAATSYFSEYFNKGRLQKLLGRLYAVKKRKQAGLLYTLERSISKKEATLHAQIRVLRKKVKELIDTVEEAFSFFLDFFSVFSEKYGGDNKNVTITSALIHQLEYKDHVYDQLCSLVGGLEEICSALQVIKKALKNCTYKEKRRKKDDEAYIESIIRKLIKCMSIVALFLKKNDEEKVKWIELEKGRGGQDAVIFRCAPIAVQELLARTLYALPQSVLLTSATMTVEGSLLYMRKRLGLDRTIATNPKKACAEYIIPSTFEYEHQVLMGIFEEMPSPEESSFREALTNTIFKVLMHTGGKAFVLFTSYALLNAVSEKLVTPLRLANISLLKQGDASRHMLLKRFREDISSVLFGTDSFWEGVDVEGESLSNVLITRLPFQVPNDPVIKARAERIKKAGGNPFIDYFLPQAVIRFKQGFGRLIRSKKDYGTVLILDSRIVRKTYGHTFLNSLPHCTLVSGNDTVVLNSIHGFFSDYKEMISFPE